MSIRFSKISEMLILVKTVSKFYKHFDRIAVLTDQHNFFID